MSIRRSTFLVLFLVFGASACASWGGRAKAPLYAGINQSESRVSLEDARARSYYDQGLTFAYARNLEEAERSFREVTVLQPEHPAGWWGVALVNGPDLNAPFGERESERAYEAIQLARQAMIAGEGSQRDRDFVEALSVRYEPLYREDRADLDQGYANAMRDLADLYPEDPDVQTLFAEALLITDPWNYFEASGTPTAPAAEALDRLERVLLEHPNHAGALHAQIHVEATGPRPGRALDSAQSLAAIEAPQASLFVHAPSYIFARAGDYERAAEASERAGAMTDGEVWASNPGGLRNAAGHSHYRHVLVWHRTIQGRAADAIRAADELAASLSSSSVEAQPALEEFVALPWLARARFGRWSEILSAPEPAEAMVYTRALRHYARSLSFANQGDLVAAREERQALNELHDRMPALALHSGRDARSVLELAAFVAEARDAQIIGDDERMLTLLAQAAELDLDRSRVAPPSLLLPLDLALAGGYASLGRFHDAERHYRADLENWPQNGWSLHGLEQSLRWQGESEEAEELKAAKARAFEGADVVLGRFATCCATPQAWKLSR